MEINNGIPSERNLKHVTLVKTNDANISWTQNDVSFVMNAGSNNKTFTFNVAPSASDVGKMFYFTNLSTGTLTVQMEATVKIADQAAGGYMTTDTDSYASLVLELVTTTMMIVRGSHGTWTAGHA
jgi:hypothetical protein